MEEIKDNTDNTPTLKEEKQRIAALVELVLYPAVISIYDKKLQEQTIEAFIEKHKGLAENMDQAQLREHIDGVLKRTCEKKGEIYIRDLEAMMKRIKGTQPQNTGSAPNKKGDDLER